MFAALGINENLNVSDSEYGTWNIILLRRPWGLTSLKRVLGISIKLLLILYIMMIFDFFFFQVSFPVLKFYHITRVDSFVVVACDKSCASGDEPFQDCLHFLRYRDSKQYTNIQELV